MHHTTFANQYELGYAGEASAIAFYEQAGYELLAHRARCRSGELDLIFARARRRNRVRGGENAPQHQLRRRRGGDLEETRHDAPLRGRVARES